MRDAALIIHFIGLAMGLGTSFGFMFLGMAGAKLKPEEALKFRLNSLALAKMGHIGLVLLLLSGGYLMTPYWGSLLEGEMHILMIKLGLFVVLGGLIGVISSYGKKAAKGDAETYFKKIETLGKLSLLTAVTIVVLAVLSFH